MVLADPPFEIDVTKQRPRPLIPAPHPSPPPKRNTTESHHDSAGQGLFQRPAREKPFSADEYVASRHVRSVLFLPLIKQAKLVGVLYIENNVAASVFTPARIAVLKLLASQAAISLDNARLYGELTMSEERWRKLFEGVPVGVNMVGLHRRYVAANPAFQRMTGYSEEELRNLTPVDITHEDDRAASEAIIAAQIAGQPSFQHPEKW